MDTAAVITALYDSYDVLKPVCPQEGMDVDWVCVTDDPDLKDDSRGWRVVYEPREGVHPNRAAKIPKLFPWRYTNAPRSVWVDASFRINSPHLASEVFAHATPMAQFVHPWRDCVYTEAVEGSLLPKYVGEDFAEQINAYRESGHPDNWGLWATGVIAREHTNAVKTFGLVWASHIDAFTYQDQVSEPVALRLCGLRPDPLPGTHFSNPWMTYEGSVRH